MPILLVSRKPVPQGHPENLLRTSIPSSAKRLGQRRRFSGVQEMEGHLWPLWTEERGNDSFRAGQDSSLEAEPETGSWVPMVYGGSAFQEKPTREGDGLAGRGRRRSREGMNANVVEGPPTT